MNKGRRGCGGFSLIEVLVALLVLAVGALGAGATLLAAGRSGHQAALLSAAVQLAAGAAERMRANTAAMRAGDALNPYLQLDYDALAAGPPAAAGDCRANPCDSATLAAADLAALRQQLFERFPLGRLRICRDGAWWDAAAAALRWDCDGAASAPVLIKIGWRQRGSDDGAAAGNAPVMLAVPLVAGVP